MSEHTKTPWSVLETESYIYINEKGGPGFVCTIGVVPHLRGKCRANARHIVHCVNNHERLVKMLKRVMASNQDFIECEKSEDLDKPDIEWSEEIQEAGNTLLAAMEAEKGGE